MKINTKGPSAQKYLSPLNRNLLQSYTRPAVFQSPCFLVLPSNRFTQSLLMKAEMGNRPFAATHSRGTKPPCWRGKVALGKDKQRKLPFQIMYVFCLSCPSATFAFQHSGFIPREWLAAKGLLWKR